MQFVFFHLMPYTGTSDTGNDWPVPNKLFEPEKGTEHYRRYIETMTYAEECGFDWVGCNEHHMSPYGLMTNCNLIGAVLAQNTRRIKIGMLGNLVPLLNPIRVAEEYAMLDVMSGGRLVAGLLRGIPHENVAYNFSPDESYARLNEAIALIKKCWTEPEPFGWEGEFYQFRAVSIWPRPVQKPHPTILMSGSSPTSAQMAAEHHAMLGLVVLQNMAQGRELIQVYKDAARASGWEPGPQDVLVAANCCISEDADEAREVLGEGRRYFAQVLGGGMRTAQKLVLQKTRYFDDTMRKQFTDVGQRARASLDDDIEQGKVLCGTPEMVVEQIRKIHRELSPGVMTINMKIGNVPDEMVMRGMRLFRDKVLPDVRDLR